MEIRSTDDSKLPVGVNVSMNGFLYVSPVSNWQLVRGLPPTSPKWDWDKWLRIMNE